VNAPAQLGLWADPAPAQLDMFDTAPPAAPAAGGAPAAESLEIPPAVSCTSCGLVHRIYADSPLIESCPAWRAEHGEVLPLVIVGCGRGKLDHPAPAGELYTGQQFRACMTAARALTTPDRIRILSAAHGLLDLDEVTAPYDVTLASVGAVTPYQLRADAERSGLLEEPVILLAGAAYTHLARSVWPAAQTPLAGLAIGKQRARLAALRKAPAAELAALAPVPTPEQRRDRQRDIWTAAANADRDHRKFCLRCVDGKRCREGRQLEADRSAAATLLGAMMRGEL